MNAAFVVIAGIIVLIYGWLNYLIGAHGWQTIFSHISFLPVWVYWLLFWLIALAFILARFSEKFLPAVIYEWLSLIGAVWLAAFLYLVLILIVLKILDLLNMWLHILPMGVRHSMAFTTGLGLTVFMLVTGILVYGAWNARHPRIHHYDISIAKPAGTLSSLHVVMVSDIHLGTIVHNGQLLQMVERINELQPDLVLLAGDVIDENIEPFIKQEMTTTFRQLHTKYGVYAVLGNHEYIGGNAEEAIKYLDAAGVQVLRDQSVKVAGSFYLVGRDDRSGARFRGAKRQALNTLLLGLDRRLPVIVMDHQPLGLAEPESQGVDLQLSGHTHAGQLFPGRLITRRMFEDDWGYLRKGNFQLIVSSGYGTWGPPIRTGNYPEIVDISLTFGK